MKKVFVIHPFLFAIFPILFLFVHNRGWFTNYKDVAILIVISVIITSTIFFLLLFVVKNSRKAGIITSLFTLLFFSYGHIYEFAYSQNLDVFLISRHRYLLLIFALLFIIGTYLCAKTKKDLDNFTKILNISALTLILITLFNLGIYEFSSKTVPQDTIENIADATTNTELLNDSPDIYYIILDAYSSSQTLKDLFNYDNSEFTNHLEEKGFYIASKSLSNYDRTPRSIPSSLNMKYLSPDIIEVEDGNVRPEKIIPMVRNNEVLRFLKSKNYTTVNVGHWWEPTSYNEYADINFEGGRYGSEFKTLLVRTTVLAPFLQSFLASDGQTEVLNMLDILENIPKNIEGPKFVFAHILSPHSPYIFGPNGEEVAPYDTTNTIENNRAYLNQLIFISKKIEHTVDVILEQSETSPIIIIQSDHGVGGTGFIKNTDDIKKFNVVDYTHLQQQSTLRNFSSFYLPDDGKNILYKTITPVNSFRLIFNHYFSAQYDILPDKSYIISRPDKEGEYTFIDITDKVKYK